MAAFSSNASKTAAVSTVNRLTASLLHVEPSASREFNSQAEDFHHASNLSSSTRKAKKNNKKANQRIEKDKKQQKFIKYQIIKAKDRAKLAPEHQKFLGKLAAKNKRLLNLQDDFELEDLQSEVLNFKPPTNQKQRKQNKKQFHEGMTPGLAPVDYESDDE